MVACLFSAARLRWDEDVLDLLPRDHPVIADFLHLSQEFGATDYLYFDVGPAREDVNLSEEELTACADGFHQRLVDSGLFTKTIYRWKADDIADALDTITRHRASLFLEQDAAQLAQKLTSEAIGNALADWKRELTESPAPMRSKDFYDDPLRMNDLFVAKLHAVQTFGTSVAIQRGRLFSQDRKHILGIALPRFRSTDSAKSKRLVEFLSDVREAMEQRDKAGRIRIAYFGGHIAGLENAQQIKSDITLTVLLSAVGIALLSLLVYRRSPLVFVTFVPVVFGGVFALGVIRLFDSTISAIAIGCGSMLIGISIDYAIHIAYTADRDETTGDAHGAMTRTVCRLFKPIMLSALTTMGAFCVLHFSILPGYRDLGRFAALGIFGAVITSLCVLPVFVYGMLAHRGREPRLRLTTVFSPLLGLTQRRRVTLGLVLLAVSSAAALGLGEFGVEGDVRRLNSVSTETQRDWDQLVRTFGDVMSSTAFGVDSPDLETGLQGNETLATALAEAQANGEVNAVSTIARLLPSTRTQAANRRRWQVFWSEARLGEVRGSFDDACEQLRMRPEVFDEFFESLTAPTSPIAPADYKEGVLQELLATHLSQSGERTTLLTRVKLSFADAFDPTLALVKRYLPEAVAFNGRALVRTIADLIYREMTKLAVISFGLILVVLLLVVRRVRLVAAMLAPLVLSVFWTVGFLGSLGIQLNMMNSAVAVFILGLIVDYSIFLTLAINDANRVRDEHVVRTCGAITISALTTLCGMGALVVARHPALHAIGATALLGLGSGIVSVFILIPLIVRPGR
ncbi:MAG: MMPL family transporter [Phycisphaerales bacterium]|nr:MAG: MMPL family transporter [Phycisphaerales bacterium]